MLMRILICMQHMLTMFASEQGTTAGVTASLLLSLLLTVEVIAPKPTEMAGGHRSITSYVFVLAGAGKMAGGQGSMSRWHT